MQKKLQHLSLGSIDSKDSLFYIASMQSSDELVESIRRYGQINPLYVQRVGRDQYRLVTGFKRYAAMCRLSCTHADCFVLSTSLSDSEVFDFVINENLTQRKFNSVEISYILVKLHETLKKDKRSIVDKYLPMLGLGASDKIYRLYYPLKDLLPVWKRALVQDSVSIELAAVVAEKGHQVQERFFSIIDHLCLSKKLQKEFWNLLNDIARLKKQAFLATLEDPAFRKMMGDVRLTPQQRAARAKSWLIQQRYPTYAAVCKRYDALIKSAKLPPALRIQASPFFADESFHIAFSVKSEAEYSRHIELLKKLADKSIIRQLFKLVQ